MAKKHKGHYCKICGEYKSNESFSGKGHTQHICKEFMGEMKKGYKKILDLPFGDNEFEIVNADEYTDTFWRIGHFAWYFLYYVPIGQISLRPLTDHIEVLTDHIGILKYPNRQ